MRPLRDHKMCTVLLKISLSWAKTTLLRKQTEIMITMSLHWWIALGIRTWSSTHKKFSLSCERSPFWARWYLIREWNRTWARSRPSLTCQILLSLFQVSVLVLNACLHSKGGTLGSKVRRTGWPTIPRPSKLSLNVVTNWPLLRWTGCRSAVPAEW